MLSVCIVWSFSKKIKLGKVGKNSVVVLVPCCVCECVPIAISGGVDSPEVPGCYLIRQMSFQWGSQNYFNDRCPMNSQPTSVILASFLLNLITIISKVLKADNIESTTLLNLALSIWIFIWIKLSWYFTLCVRKILIIQSILVISLRRVIFC